MAQENGVLAKLAQYRREFLEGFEAEATAFATKLRTLREDYLNKIVDATLTDPRLVDIERALAFRSAQLGGPFQPILPTAAGPAVAIPEKWPMKGRKGVCPGCGWVIPEPSARFCSQCAHPLFPF